MLKKLDLKYIGIIIAVLMVMVLSYSVYLAFDLHGTVYKPLENNEEKGSEKEEANKNETTEGERITDDSVLNVLLIGVDSDGEDTRPNAGRSDTIMIARYNQENNQVGIVSVPRDTRVNLPGRGHEKINHAYAYGGVSYLKEALESFLEIDIHNYVMVDFKGFENVVDIVDGVEIDVEQDMYYYDDALDEVIVDLEEGKQVLDGEDALGYVRWRGGEDADIGRVRRQQEFLEEMIDEVFKFGSVLKVRRLAGEITSNLVMDFRVGEVISLAPKINKVDWDNMSTKVLNGNSVLIDGIWYYEVDKEEARNKVDNLVRK